MKVFAVGWEFDGGGGFDWYYQKSAQKIALKTEQENVKAFKNENWIAFTFSADVPEDVDTERVTELIDANIWQLGKEPRKINGCHFDLLNK
jgi:hypothetical protein